MKRLGPGIHDGVPMDVYQADPCSKPSLSAGIARLLCDRTPKHAWAKHPRLNPDLQRTESGTFDNGTAAHALLLDGENVCHVVEAADWRTKGAREVRDKARENGLIPLLVHQWDEVQTMCAAVREQLPGFHVLPRLLADGKPEQTLVWRERGVLCRGRADWLRDDHTAIDDLKTTGASADPREWARRKLWEIGADVQAAFYMRGIKALGGKTPVFRWIVVENTPPYAVSVMSLAPSALEQANDKVDYALDKWRECLKTGQWPAYPTQVAYAELPPWEATRWHEARYLDEQGAQAAA